MINALTVTNYLGESLRIDLFDPDPSGFIVQKIDGLGPVKATLNFTEFATLDGAIDNLARKNTRNIVIYLIFQEHSSIEDTRQLTYKYFPVKKTVNLSIETDNRTCVTTGRVESNDPDIFNEQEGCQISIVCSDPYMYSPADKKTITYYSRVVGLFEFPFSSDGISGYQSDGQSYNTQSYPIEFGASYTIYENAIWYDGDADTGILIKMIFNGDLGSSDVIYIYQQEVREYFAINNNKVILPTGLNGTNEIGIKKNDIIYINTKRGHKGITLIRNGVYYNVINSIYRDSSWFQLNKGINTIMFNVLDGQGQASGNASLIEFLIENDTIYEGV